eukprot:jgi/Mesvir1/28132/Mv04706-RA.2
MEHIHAHDEKHAAYSSFTVYDPVKVAERWERSGKLRKAPSGATTSRPSIIPGSVGRAGFQATEWRFLRETTPTPSSASPDSFRAHEYAGHAYPPFTDSNMPFRGQPVYPVPPATAHLAGSMPARRPFASMDGRMGMLRQHASHPRENGGSQGGARPGSSGTIALRRSLQHPTGRRNSEGWMAGHRTSVGGRPYGIARDAASPPGGSRPSSQRRSATVYGPRGMSGAPGNHDHPAADHGYYDETRDDEFRDGGGSGHGYGYGAGGGDMHGQTSREGSAHGPREGVHGNDHGAWPTPKVQGRPPAPNRGLPFEEVVECTAQVKWEGEDDMDGDYESAEEGSIRAQWRGEEGVEGGDEATTGGLKHRTMRHAGEAEDTSPAEGDPSEPASPGEGEPEGGSAYPREGGPTSPMVSSRPRVPPSRVTEISGGTLSGLHDTMQNVRASFSSQAGRGGARRRGSGDTAVGRIVAELEGSSGEGTGGEGGGTGIGISSSDSDNSSVCFVTEAEANGGRQRRRWKNPAHRAGGKSAMGNAGAEFTGMSSKGFFARRGISRGNAVPGAGISSSGVSRGGETARRGRQQHPVDREMAGLLDGLSSPGMGADARDNDMPVLVWRPSARVKLPLGLPPALLAELGDEEDPAPRGFLTSRRAARSSGALGSDEDDQEVAAQVAAMYSLADGGKARSWVGPRHCGTVPGESPRKENARYGSWYIPPKLWKEAAEGVDFLSHSRRPKDGHRGAEQAVCVAGGVGLTRAAPRRIRSCLIRSIGGKIGGHLSTACPAIDLFWASPGPDYGRHVLPGVLS